jgi:Zn-dependent protease
MQAIDTIFYIAILMFSVMVHEVAHGLVAYKQGDPTAKVAGRLTLNPIKHIDLFGTIILPLLLAISGTGLMFGWAKPVPYNPNNFKNRRKGTIFVAAAGVVTNLIIACIFSILIRFLPDMTFIDAVMAASLLKISVMIVLINLVLAIFNLIPIPPLDGSRILFSLLPARFIKYEYILDRYAIVFLIIIIFIGFRLISPLIFGAFTLFTGLYL